jgi:hypothetical protein
MYLVKLVKLEWRAGCAMYVVKLVVKLVVKRVVKLVKLEWRAGCAAWHAGQ